MEESRKEKRMGRRKRVDRDCIERGRQRGLKGAKEELYGEESGKAKGEQEDGRG